MEPIFIIITLLLMAAVAWFADREIEKLKGRVGALESQNAELSERVRKHVTPECLKGGTTFLYYMSTLDVWKCDDPSCHRRDCRYKYPTNMG